MGSIAVLTEDKSSINNKKGNIELTTFPDVFHLFFFFFCEEDMWEKHIKVWLLWELEGEANFKNDNPLKKQHLPVCEHYSVIF